jgi:hypothetical protein
VFVKLRPRHVAKRRRQLERVYGGDRRGSVRQYIAVRRGILDIGGRIVVRCLIVAARLLGVGELTVDHVAVRRGILDIGRWILSVRRRTSDRLRRKLYGKDVRFGRLRWHVRRLPSFTALRLVADLHRSTGHDERRRGREGARHADLERHLRGGRQ